MQGLLKIFILYFRVKVVKPRPVVFSLSASSRRHQAQLLLNTGQVIIIIFKGKCLPNNIRALKVRILSNQFAANFIKIYQGLKKL